MSLVIEPFELQGVFLCRPKKFADPRGYFMETYNQRAYAEAGIACVFVQDNQSLSVRRGTIRGLLTMRASPGRVPNLSVERDLFTDSILVRA
jgi:dTDP-4-dehydrorhamnose 3,5-epimerase-like enzyme